MTKKFGYECKKFLHRYLSFRRPPNHRITFVICTSKHAKAIATEELLRQAYAGHFNGLPRT
ncbi:hypothetical protein [Desulfonema magnum]|uniref:Uncharacterized protein n=1 Tax=Desulfonema magnum TaxID=45655 RepID=A0A975GTB7_9BACT|nr:hypothetical protein [Desulfonema magnum]QTA92921.1 Uncharacterized protein dnm_090140 [Desulfonema magnum]